MKNLLRATWLKATTRFFGWWLGITGVAAMSGTCPCCGAGICARGLAFYGLLGAIFSSLLRPRQTHTAINGGNASNWESSTETGPLSKPLTEAPLFASHDTGFTS